MNQSYTAVAAVAGDDTRYRYEFPLHIITDCYSLHECVTRSGLPKDQRAAIEILAIREIVKAQGELEDSDNEILGDSRLREYAIDKCYHWCCSQEMKADMLTKILTGLARREWMLNLNNIVITPRPKINDGLPSTKRPQFKKQLLQDALVEMGLNEEIWQ